MFLLWLRDSSKKQKPQAEAATCLASSVSQSRLSLSLTLYASSVVPNVLTVVISLFAQVWQKETFAHSER